MPPMPSPTPTEPAVDSTYAWARLMVSMLMTTLFGMAVGG